MKKKLFISFLFTIMSVFTYSYGQEITIHGRVIDKIGIVSNVNILNTTSKKGTFSDDLGFFSIKVSLGTELEFTSIQHYKKVVVIDHNILTTQSITIELYLKDNLLEEVNVSNKKMFGTFKRNVTQSTRDIAVVKSRGALDFSDIKIKENKNYHKATTLNRELNNITDPTQRFEGASLGGAFIPFGSILKRRKQKKKFEFKRNFPSLILKELGERFFFKELKIPENKFYHFLEYCNPLEIEKLYQEGNILEVIEILIKESKEYLINDMHK
ncbi:hypothetical protein [Tenacibaculum sp. 190524A05c]|uniref:hypothetical protein n=1 Tax=Tenacibaculum platacis TaxID=3137852 RepID=UPI0032B231FA